jgi:carbonic anhydrase
MQPSTLRIVTLAAGLTLAGAAMAGGHGAHWGYQGGHGPAHWGELDAAFATCGSGRNQSPVDLGEAVHADLPPAHVAYADSTLEVVNNGHTIQANVTGTSHATVDGRDFKLVQFHFHAPSEHTVNGEHSPMEAHFVHQDDDGNLLVIGVLLEEGEPNALLDRVLANAPEHQGHHAVAGAHIDPAGLLPDDDDDLYRYSGSLTTPPCSEGVRWLVMREPVSVSAAQVQRFSALIGHNNRPPQALNARLVTSDD